jgi:hypothetical protein
MDDSSAIQKCLAGDWESFRHLVEKYQGRAVGHALLAIAVFGLLRENPFKINSELQAPTSDLNFRFER